MNSVAFGLRIFEYKANNSLKHRYNASIVIPIERKILIILVNYFWNILAVHILLILPKQLPWLFGKTAQQHILIWNPCSLICDWLGNFTDSFSSLKWYWLATLLQTLQH